MAILSFCSDFKDLYGPGGASLDNLDYHYLTGKNQLAYIDDSHGDQGVEDLKDQASGNYTYDLDGQLIDDVSEDVKIEYDVYGKVIVVKERSTNNTLVKYFYGPEGYRVRKDSYWRDGSGTLTNIQSTYYILGSAWRITLPLHFG